MPIQSAQHETSVGHPREELFPRSLSGMASPSACGRRTSSIQAELSAPNAQLTIPLFTLALGAILSMPFVGRVFHRFDSSALAWKGQICYAVALSLLPWTKSLTWLATGTFGFGLLRGMVDVSTNTQAIITERAYGSAVMSSLQGFWSLGGVIGAVFSSVLLRQHATARKIWPLLPLP